ncbi:hypothetical protein [Persicitalea jodogahamensis]|uniref:Uncharacterized protein n=1 Tax=Persicitalea jodogahamensis TaxID=402147 RepID=A0A8J3DC27_9BACT|nr:hypothetical protein [Persicitalea jodogahamensis]GHB81344.1 hypothetical protein GCM10007390_40200 [Persicitalea jodogahamensis]
MKILRVIVLLIFGLIWLAGCSNEILFTLYKNEIIPDDYRYGDLYRLSNLAEFRDPKQECPGITLPEPRQKIAFYLIGDSFTERQRVDSSDFAVTRYYWAHWGENLHFKLDTAFTNIILLESVERNVRPHFGTPISNLIPDSSTFIQLPGDERFMHRLDRMFASDGVEDRLNTILFQFDPILRFKELKSWINQRFFDRTDPKVTLSGDGSTLAYYEDTDSTLINSSYNTVPDSEVDSLVVVINYDEMLLKNMGFDQVWFSVIPNKATVLMPNYGAYNHIIERISQHPELDVPSVQILHEFMNVGSGAYLTGDSHWSCSGQRLWLEKVNQQVLGIGGI